MKKLLKVLGHLFVITGLSAHWTIKRVAELTICVLVFIAIVGGVFSLGSSIYERGLTKGQSSSMADFIMGYLSGAEETRKKMCKDI